MSKHARQRARACEEESLQTTVRNTLNFGIAVLASRHACHAIERVQSISALFSASKSVEVRALGSLIRAFSGWSKAAARVAAVLRNAGVIMLVRRDILSKRGFLAGSGRLVPDGERHEHGSHQNGVPAALLVSRRRRHEEKAPLPNLAISASCHSSVCACRVEASMVPETRPPGHAMEP